MIYYSWLLSVVLLVFVNSLFGIERVGFTVLGVTDWSDSTMVSLKGVEGNGAVIDSTMVMDGVFRLNGDVQIGNSGSEYYLAGLQFVNKNRTRQVNKAMLLEEGTIIVSMVGDRLTCGGSIVQTRFSDFQNNLFVFIDSIRYFKKNASRAAMREDSVGYRLMTRSAKRYKKKGDNLVLDYWDKYPKEKFIYSFIPFTLSTNSRLINERIRDSANKYAPTFFRSKIKASIAQQSKQEKNDDSNYLASGEIAPNFTLYTYKNKQVDLKEKRGKYIVLNFWASWCKPCLKEMSELDKINKEFSLNSLEIISINVKDNAENWERMLDNKDWNWVHVRDMDGDVASMYNVYYIPYNIVIDKEGIVISKEREVSELKAVLSNLLSN